MTIGLSLVLCALLAAAPPLTESQRTAVEDVTDRAPNIDEAGLYALLNNASTWPTKIDPLLPGARLPDIDQLRNQPANTRGEMFIIDGRLESMAPPALYSPARYLSQPGWDNVEVWHVRLDNGGLAILCLTDPPDVAGQAVNGQRVPTIENLTVRVPARFYKLLNTPGQDGTWRTYPVFVGHSARITGGTGPSQEDDDGFNAIPYAALFGGVIVMLLIFGYIRARSKRPSPLAARLERAHAQAQAEVEPVRTDLPGDPAAALTTLADEHDHGPPPEGSPAFDSNKEPDAHGDR